jgi:hypothetical protein
MMMRNACAMVYAVCLLGTLCRAQSETAASGSITVESRRVAAVAEELNRLVERYRAEVVSQNLGDTMGLNRRRYTSLSVSVVLPSSMAPRFLSEVRRTGRVISENYTQNTSRANARELRERLDTYRRFIDKTPGIPQEILREILNQTALLERQLERAERLSAREADRASISVTVQEPGAATGGEYTTIDWLNFWNILAIGVIAVVFFLLGKAGRCKTAPGATDTTLDDRV